jgi:hypothetical protein
LFLFFFVCVFLFAMAPNVSVHRTGFSN